MMNRREWKQFLFTVGIVGGLAVCLGCSSESSETVALREAFLLEQEPASVLTLTEAIEAMSQEREVAFVGRIPTQERESFVSGKASFLVMEYLPGEPGHDDPEHADNCPFCKRREANALKAAVQFVDKQGEVIAQDARELLGIQAGDVVVIRGQGSMVPGLELLQVNATGLFVKPQADPSTPAKASPQ